MNPTPASGLVTLLACTLPWLAPLAAAAGTDPARPNIIFILADDVGLGETGCTGGDRFKTPRIDALAEGGTRFDHCYSMPMCGPSRFTFLTGRYPFRTGLAGNNSFGKGNTGAYRPATREVMIPAVLKAAGYVTAAAGKWGQMPAGPDDWGFDESLAAGNGQYWKGKYFLNGKSQTLADGKYMPDLIHDFLVDFIGRHKEEPFFVYYPMIHIHIPIQRTPDSAPDATDDQLYADNVAYMDKLVGKLVEELDRLKLRGKTLIVFAGDNGSIRPPAYTPVKGRQLSGNKASMREGGSRVPMIANWPGTTPAGAISHDLTDFSDFFTTFAELAGAKLPDGVELDGRSIAARIKGGKGTPREWVYVELTGKSFVRDVRWKLGNDGGFFDLKDAPFEELPVAGDTTDTAALAARKKLQAVLDTHKAAPWDGTARPPGKPAAKGPATPGNPKPPKP
jgi:arylsulfatase A